MADSIKRVTHNGSKLLVRESVMETMGLRNGQAVTTQQMLECIRLNAAALVVEMELLKAAGAKDVPDTTNLRHLIDQF